MRDKFLSWGTVIVIVLWVLAIVFKSQFWLPAIITGIYVIGLFDAFQTKHAIKRNFPVLGNFRYLFEEISPEIQQYFIERESDGKPFPRNQRSAAYRGTVDNAV